MLANRLAHLLVRLVEEHVVDAGRILELDRVLTQLQVMFLTHGRTRSGHFVRLQFH